MILVLTFDLEDDAPADRWWNPILGYAEVGAPVLPPHRLQADDGASVLPTCARYTTCFIAPRGSLPYPRA